MTIPIYQVDAFTSHLFGGNPAAVCPLDAWLPNAVLQSIAQENNLAETAYFVKDGADFHIRWFTPEYEMDLCGHATLASAHVLYQHLHYQGERIVFTSASGDLVVTKNDDLLTLDFPARMPGDTVIPDGLLEGMGKNPQEVYKARDYVLVYASETEVRGLQPNALLLQGIEVGTGGIIATAPGDTVDFVSRFFIPGASVFEDPVTGSAHCSLIPFWADRLHKNTLHALQVSARTGELFCENRGDRVWMSGRSVTYLEGMIRVK